MHSSHQGDAAAGRAAAFMERPQPSKAADMDLTP
eukprot:gene780-5585_t